MLIVRSHECVNDKTSCCSNPNVIRTMDDTYVCKNCGTVINDEVFYNLEKRMYTRYERMMRKRNESPLRSFGPRTIINYYDAKEKDHVYYKRLSRIQNSLINSFERNLFIAEPILQKKISNLNLPSYVKDTAWRIYREIAIRKITKGRSIDAFITACIYVSIRIHKYPLNFKKVFEESESTIRSVRHSIKRIIQDILPDLGYKYVPSTPQELVFHFGSELGLPTKIQYNTKILIDRLMKKNPHLIGKDPKGIIAACFYFFCKKENINYTQEKISEIIEISEVTMRHRIKDLKKILGMKKNERF